MRSKKEIKEKCLLLIMKCESRVVLGRDESQVIQVYHCIGLQ